MTMHEALHPRDNIRLYMSKKEGRREFPSVKDCEDASIQGLLEYIKKAEKYYLQLPVTEMTWDPAEKQLKLENKNEKKQLYGYLKR